MGVRLKESCCRRRYCTSPSRLLMSPLCIAVKPDVIQRSYQSNRVFWNGLSSGSSRDYLCTCSQMVLSGMPRSNRFRRAGRFCDSDEANKIARSSFRVISSAAQERTATRHLGNTHRGSISSTCIRNRSTRGILPNLFPVEPRLACHRISYCG